MTRPTLLAQSAGPFVQRRIHGLRGAFTISAGQAATVRCPVRLAPVVHVAGPTRQPKYPERNSYSSWPSRSAGTAATSGRLAPLPRRPTLLLRLLRPTGCVVPVGWLGLHGRLTIQHGSASQPAWVGWHDYRPKLVDQSTILCSPAPTAARRRCHGQSAPLMRTADPCVTAEGPVKLAM